MASLIQTLRTHKAVAYVDDERNIGNSIIITLNDGYEFGDDPGCGVRGVDTLKEGLQAVRKWALPYLHAAIKTVPPAYFAQHELDEDKVQSFMNLLSQGKWLPRPVLAEYDGSFMPLDGHHRMQAHCNLRMSLEAWVVPGAAFDELCTRTTNAEAFVRCGKVKAMQLAEHERCAKK